MGMISKIFNFDNVGEKIKIFAKWSCWITILLIWIAAPISFFALLANRWLSDLCWIPIVLAIVGPFFVWICSWMFFAFGEFVEDVHAMRNKEGTTAEVTAKRESEAKAKLKTEQLAYLKMQITQEKIMCPDKNENTDDYVDIFCPMCGELLSFLKEESEGVCLECGAEFPIK